MLPQQWADLPRDRFGDAPAMQDELAALVIAGRKTATCFAEGTGPIPAVGDRAVIENGSGHLVCVIETVALQRRRFDEVDEQHARNEGEGDLSLGYWREVHRAYFQREGTFSEDMMLVCEDFRLVAVLSEAAR
jgi:uncharacterized protein YhfF